MAETKEYCGTSFHAETPIEVCQILNTAIISRRTRFDGGQRLRIFYGSDGSIWQDEFDMLGYIGRSTGFKKIPLMIANSRSHGGGGILDHCIVRIQDASSKRVLYMADGYELPEYEIVPAVNNPDYPFQVFRKSGEHAASFKTEKQADRWIAFMRGERMAK